MLICYLKWYGYQFSHKKENNTYKIRVHKLSDDLQLKMIEQLPICNFFKNASFSSACEMYRILFQFHPYKLLLQFFYRIIGEPLPVSPWGRNFPFGSACRGPWYITPARESSDSIVALIPLTAFVELVSGHEIQDLRENDSSGMHRPFLS